MEFIRDIVYQPFDTQSLLVGITPTQILPKAAKSDLISAFVVSVPAAAANNVFIGNTGVTTTSGLEIVAGAGPCEFRIRNQNVQYDIHSLLKPVIESIPCTLTYIHNIPYIIFDLTQICLIAVAPTTVAIWPIRSQFV